MMPSQKSGMDMPKRPSSIEPRSASAARLDRGAYAQRHGDDDRQRQRHQGELDRHRQPHRQQRRHRLVAAVVLAQVALQDLAQPLQVLFR